LGTFAPLQFKLAERARQIAEDEMVVLFDIAYKGSLLNEKPGTLVLTDSSLIFESYPFVGDSPHSINSPQVVEKLLLKDIVGATRHRGTLLDLLARLAYADAIEIRSRSQQTLRLHVRNAVGWVKAIEHMRGGSLML
jgi:hypothetical protein